MAPPALVPPRIPTGKSAVPELPAEFVPRPRLRAGLDAATADQVVVLSAPAGFGKTLLLADWVRAGADRPTAWVALDGDDNDPRRLWTAVVTSLLALPEVGRRLPVARRRRGRPRCARTATSSTSWPTRSTGLDPPVRLVLDDVHELTGPRGAARPHAG